MKKRIKIYILFLIIGIIGIKIFELNIPSILWIKADIAFHKGDYDKVESYLGRIIKLNPYNSTPFVLKAWLEWSQAISYENRGIGGDKKLYQALKTLKKGQWFNPYNFNLYLEEGIMWNAFKQDELALLAFKKVYLFAPIPYARLYPHKLRQMGKTYQAYRVMKKIYEKYKDEVTACCLERLKRELSS